MVKTRVEVRTDADAAGTVQSAADEHMFAVAQAGFNRSQEVIFEEATDTGQLARSGFQPTKQGDRVIYGWSADYAAAVDQGSVPHWAPIKPLLGWVRRVFGVSGSDMWASAKGVQKKIAAEGTDGVDYVEKGLEAARAEANQRGLDTLISERL